MHYRLFLLIALVCGNFIISSTILSGNIILPCYESCLQIFTWYNLHYMFCAIGFYHLRQVLVYISSGKFFLIPLSILYIHITVIVLLFENGSEHIIGRKYLILTAARIYKRKMLVMCYFFLVCSMICQPSSQCVIFLLFFFLACSILV